MTWKVYFAQINNAHSTKKFDPLSWLYSFGGTMYGARS